MSGRWRTGTKIKRNLYCDDEPIAMLAEEHTAESIAEKMNYAETVWREVERLQRELEEAKSGKLVNEYPTLGAIQYQRIQQLESELEAVKVERDQLRKSAVEVCEGKILHFNDLLEQNRALTAQVSLLREALRKLMNEASGIIGAYEPMLSELIGNTNAAVLHQRVVEARDVLAALEVKSDAK